MSKCLETFEELEKPYCRYCPEHFDGKCNRDNDDYDGNECIINVLRKYFEVLQIIEGIKPFEVVEMLNGKMYLCTIVDKVELTKKNYKTLKEWLDNDN